jgi:hypothetical protein
MNLASYEFRKSFSRTSVYGITFHWLKCTYGKFFEDAIANAVWTVYASLAFAAAPESCSKVNELVLNSREHFNQIVELAKGAPVAEEPIPKRVKVAFERCIDLSLKEGQVFDWLIQNYGAKAAEPIIHAVWLVYSPAALSAFPESGKDAQAQAQRSRLVFEDMMTWAVFQSSSDQTALIANRLDKTLLNSSIDEPVTQVQPPTQAQLLPPAEADKTSSSVEPLELPDATPTTAEEQTTASNDEPASDTASTETVTDGADAEAPNDGETDGETEDNFDDDFVPPHYDLDWQ